MRKRIGRIPLDEAINAPVTIPLKEALNEWVTYHNRTIADIVRESLTRNLFTNYNDFETIYKQKLAEYDARQNIFGGSTDE